MEVYHTRLHFQHMLTEFQQDATAHNCCHDVLPPWYLHAQGGPLKLFLEMPPQNSGRPAPCLSLLRAERRL